MSEKKQSDSNSETEESKYYEELQRSYAVEFQSQSYASFYNTKMEKDKSVLTLSVAGIGFLITFINLSNRLSIFEYLIFFVAAIGYLTCIYFVLQIFDKNADYIITLTTDGDVGEKEKILKKYDSIVVRSFYLAITLSFIIGVSTSINQQNMEANVSGTEKKSSSESQCRSSNESFAEAQQLKRSFEGASSMKPSQQPQNSSKSESDSNQNSGKENDEK